MLENTISLPRETVCSPRGALSDAVLDLLTNGADEHVPHPISQVRRALSVATDIVRDDDIQMALFLLYASSYGSLGYLNPDLEWDTRVIETRYELETAFEGALRAQVPISELALANPTEPTAREVAAKLFELASAETGPSLAKYFAKKATLEEARQHLILRSIYTLREADAHSWAIPRLTGRAKAALVEIQSDEYGGGRPDRAHAEIYAKAMLGAGLNAKYGAYLDVVPAITLASQNMMSMFGLNRRLIGAIVGHLAAFEMTSSVPCRLYADGLRRLGFGENVTDYYDEHVEADAVHEQIAARDLAGSLAEDQPALLHDIFFGASACLTVDGWASQHTLDAWQRGESPLREGSLV